MTKIVFDLGGTNSRVAKVLDGSLDRVLRKPTPQDREKWGEHIRSMVEEVSREDKVEMIVGGVAGLRSRDVVASALPEAKIYNDALMSGLGEAVYGVGKDKEVVGYIGLGTGIGTARISHKNIDTRGFEAGHHIIDSSMNESWEQKVSGKLIKEKHGKYPQEIDKEAYEEYVKKIAVGVYNAILFWSPEVIVMGGSLINEDEGFKLEEISSAVRETNKALDILPPIMKSALGDDAGLYGAMAIIENEVK